MPRAPRPGFHTVTPRIVTADVAGQIVYVADADTTHRRSLAAGAASLEPPSDTPYGDRRAMVRDPFGNVWQIAHVL